MDEDVPMDEDPRPEKPKTGDELDEYNLDNYDDEDDTPGTF